MRYEVVIVGGSLAGCSAAIFFARRGLKVALVERNPDLQAYKKVCTHFIQPSAFPVLQRLGLDEVIETAGGVKSHTHNWNRWGWFSNDRLTEEMEPIPPGYCLRREKLDPLLRQMAIDTPNITFMPGHNARGLMWEDGVVKGVRLESKTASAQTLQGKLIVGADGRQSRLAKLAGVKEVVRPNNRFIYFAYYRNLPLKSGTDTQFWLKQPEVAYAFPNDDNVTLLACLLPKAQLTAFKTDIEGNFTRFFKSLSDAPNLDEGERVSEMRGILEVPNIFRTPVAPGLALIGDAAVVSDPL